MMANTPSIHTPEIAVSLRNVTHHYRKEMALSNISMQIPAGRMTGLIGPDGVGKSTLLSLITGARKIQQGEIAVLHGNIADAGFRRKICPQIAYMPQGLGKNLYFTLTGEENLQFFARLFGHGAEERRQRIDDLTRSTGLYPFLDRPAGKLSGGMKQKLGLCCALIHDPDLLVLDEPTTGVDPLARRQFWDLINRIRTGRPQLTVIVATAYMDEAQGFEYLFAMNDGEILAEGSPQELMQKTGTAVLDDAFLQLLPESKKSDHHAIHIPPLPPPDGSPPAIQAEELTKQFGTFTAVDHVNFQIRQGEIFGFLGSNGCGKTTTMRMLTGLLPPTSGQSFLFGRKITGLDLQARKELGYMTQSFSLYDELTLQQNLQLCARLCMMQESLIPERLAEILQFFHLEEYAEDFPASLPMGIRQRMSLAAAVIHRPRILILDEPTSGVDPVARDNFWELLVRLSRQDKVTIFITTHFMNEALRCDRISLMHAGKSLACGTAAELIRNQQADTLEEAFIRYLEKAAPEEKIPDTGKTVPVQTEATFEKVSTHFNFQRWYSCFLRENLELLRDPIRLILAVFGALLLLLVIGFGANMDVNDLTFAVLDRDRSAESVSYIMNLTGSRYFKEEAPVRDYFDLDRRMRDGKVNMVLEIPPGFGRKIQRGESPAISVWLDGAMPSRARTIQGYISGLHATWLRDMSHEYPQAAPRPLADVEIRYRYNPDVQSLPAMVPAEIPILLMVIPAILAALSVVREKELGSITNLYVTPLTRAEFLLGKQIPYLLFAFASSLLLLLEAYWVFGITVKGSLAALLAAMGLYCICATGLGLLFSSLTRSQIAVLFLTITGTIIPTVQFCGLTQPVQSLTGAGKIIGTIYPASPMLIICRGVLNKSLDFNQLHMQFLELAVMAAVIVTSGILLQKKQTA